MTTTEDLVKCHLEEQQRRRIGSVFHHAARLNVEKTLAALSMIDDKNPRNARGQTPLAVFVSKKCSTAVASLVAAGGDPNLADNSKRSPLRIAIENNDALSVEALLDAGADPDAPDYGSCLTLAVGNNLEGIARILLSRGLPADSLSPGSLHLLGAGVPVLRLLEEFGWSPPDNQGTLDNLLLDAAYGENAEQADYYLSKGASPNAHIISDTALHIALSSPSKESADVAVLLFRAGADVRIRGSRNSTPIDRLMFHHSTTALEALLEEGLDPNCEHVHPGSLLAAAASFRPAAVSLLLSKGADPNRRGRNGTTPLHWAAESSDMASVECVEILLAAGADPFAKDWLGRTPFDICDHQTRKEALFDEALLLSETGSGGTSTKDIGAGENRL